ncbi:unnamed protein product, partial [Iphiclides podalirius]
MSSWVEGSDDTFHSPISLHSSSDTFHRFYVCLNCHNFRRKIAQERQKRSPKSPPPPPPPPPDPRPTRTDTRGTTHAPSRFPPKRARRNDDRTEAICRTKKNLPTIKCEPRIALPARRTNSAISDVSTPSWSYVENGV